MLFQSFFLQIVELLVQRGAQTGLLDSDGASTQHLVASSALAQR